MRDITPYTRGGLLEAIGTVNALALTARDTPAYLHWEARETELREKAAPLTLSEESKIHALSQERRRIYEGH